MAKELKIWGIIEGPFHIDEVPYDVRPNEDDMEFMMVLKMETDVDDIDDFEVWFKSMEEVDLLKNHFSKNIEPFVFTIEGVEE